MLKEFRHNENTKKLIIFGLYVYSTEMRPANPIKIVLQEISREHVANFLINKIRMIWQYLDRNMF